MRDLFQSAEKENEIRMMFQDFFVPKGYREVTLPVLEAYETYETLQSNQRRKSLLKLINPSGEILVLRPDVTIPLMRELATANDSIDEELRCWYLQSVFRQTADTTMPTERRQAGIECFSPQSIANDSEVIALACLGLHQLGIHDFKIEIGHAGIVKEMSRVLQLSVPQQIQVNAFIQTKNSGGLQEFLSEHKVNEQISNIFLQLIFSYGSADAIFERMQDLNLSQEMHSILLHVKAVWKRVVEGGYENHVTIDLGMVNDMDYYSGIQFQGFSGVIGSPLLMGGRYDEVSRNFGIELPAVGFACDVEALIAASKEGVK